MLGCLVLLTSACGEQREVEITISTGQEEGALSQDPAVTLVEIVALTPDSADGTLRPFASDEVAPGEAFDLGEMPDTSIINFEITGTDADGNVVARGRSTSVAIGALDEPAELPLFIQRLGAFARVPSNLARAHVHAPGGVLGEQFLIATGGDVAVGEDGSEGDPKLGDYYDMLALSGIAATTLPRTARSLVVIGGTQLLLIDEDGATVGDTLTDEITEVTPPEDFTFAEISGGTSFWNGDLESPVYFVAGATRAAGEPTNAILIVEASGAISAVRLASARKGAAGVYIPDVGLVIAGGSADGDGVEVVTDDGDVTSLPYPPDATSGAAGVIFADETVVLLGGRDSDENPAATRALDLGCVVCEAEVVPDADIPEIATRGLAFNTPTGLLVFGEAEPEGEGPGETLAFLVAIDVASTVTSLPFRERRRGATPVAAPNGTVAVLGGIAPDGDPALSVELWFPE